MWALVVIIMNGQGTAATSLDNRYFMYVTRPACIEAGEDMKKNAEVGYASVQYFCVPGHGALANERNSR